MNYIGGCDQEEGEITGAQRKQNMLDIYLPRVVYQQAYGVREDYGLLLGWLVTSTDEKRQHFQLFLNP